VKDVPLTQLAAREMGWKAEKAHRCSRVVTILCLEITHFDCLLFRKFCRTLNFPISEGPIIFEVCIVLFFFESGSLTFSSTAKRNVVVYGFIESTSPTVSFVNAAPEKPFLCFQNVTKELGADSMNKNRSSSKPAKNKSLLRPTSEIQTKKSEKTLLVNTKVTSVPIRFY
jgi:hypothetical protein